MSQRSLASVPLRDGPCSEEVAESLTTSAGDKKLETLEKIASATARRLKIADRACAHYHAHRWDPQPLLRTLPVVLRRACELEVVELLDEVISLAIAEGRHLRHPLCAFYSLSGARAIAGRLAAQHILAFAWALDDLSRLRPAPTTQAWRSLEQDVVTSIAEGASPAELEVYLRLIAADAHTFPHDAYVDLDLFGEVTAAFRELRAGKPAAEDLQVLKDAIEAQRKVGQSALAVVRAFGALASSGGVGRGSLSVFAQYSNALSRFAAVGTSADMPPFRRLLDQLMQTVRSGDIVAVFSAGACLLAREGRTRDLAKLQSLCERVHHWVMRPQLLRNLVQAADEGMITTSAELIEALDHASAHGALEHLQLASQQTAIASASTAFHEFTEAALGDLAIVVQAERSLAEWQRVAEHRDRFTLEGQLRGQAESPAPPPPSPLDVNPHHLQTILRLQDKFFGFTALRFASQRTPLRGAAELVRFGNDVGRVSYVNAKDIARFPGRGFFIRELKLHKIFVAEEASNDASGESSDPYRAYRRAWPSLASEFEDLEQAEFLLTRGMVVVSCRTLNKYTLAFRDGSQHQMSLAIFNDHFRNPRSSEACLIPTALLRKRLGKCFVGYEDYTGFQPRRPDANQTIGSIALLLHDKQFGQYIVSVGEPGRLRSGFPQFSDAMPLYLDDAMWSRFTATVESFNARLRAWERRGHSYHFSSEGLRENRALTKASAELAHAAANIARDDRDRLYRAAARMREADRPVWKITEQHLNLLDLFFLSLAAWHKGYTQGEIVPRESPESEDEPGVPLGKADQLVLGRDDAVFWNQNSIRMLALAYEWHAQRRRGVLEPNQYPILTITDTLKLGSVDPPQCWLDTFDMVAHLPTGDVPLTTDTMTSDDELFWHTQFMPHAADQPGKLNDLRFYPRESLGIA